MPRRWSVFLLVAALATACSHPAADRAGGTGPAPSAPPSSTTTTTAVPVPVDAQDIVVATTMTDRGRRLFLAAGPTVDDVSTFAHDCGLDADHSPSPEARVYTHGCYVNGRIHLLAASSAEAHDLLSVVAAHELLHAAYAQLSGADRTRIDAELQAARGNARLEERLKAYGEGPTLLNEIHSILGSEFDGLSPVLEAHYAQFFADRSVVVAVRRRTLGVREDEIRRLQVDTDDLEARLDGLRDDPQTVRTAGGVRTFNALVDRLNAEVADLNQRVEEYNALLAA